jgi:hypothetical protein
MSGLDWAVLLGGIAAIAWVNWYFFIAGSGHARPARRPNVRAGE